MTTDTFNMAGRFGKKAKSLGKSWVKAGSLAAILALGACATATPYQPALNASASNGFSDVKIENDRARISFDGNSLTKRDTVETYLLYRAAELARENGFDYFTLTQRNTDKKSRVVSTGFNDPYYGYFDYSYFHPRHGWGSPRFHSPFYRHHPRSALFGRFNDPFYSRLGYGGWGYNGFGSDFDYREISRYRASAEVKFGRGSKPHNDDNSFNAREVIENLGPKIIYPEQKA